MRISTTDEFKSPIKIVYFDEKDIEILGGWPLSRNIYGYFAQKLNELGAKAIGFHVFWGKRSVPNDENDLFLSALLNKHDNIVGSFYFQTLDRASSSGKSYTQLALQGQDLPRDVLVAAGLIPPDSLYLNGQTKFGFTNLLSSANGIIENAYLLVSYAGRVYPSFSGRLAQVYSDGRCTVPPKIKINFKLRSEQLPLIPVRELIDPQNATNLRNEFHNTIVIVGVISSQLGFTNPTPIDSAMPVVAIHAQIIDNLLSGEYLRTWPRYLFLITFICIIAGVHLLKFKNKVEIAILSALAIFFVSASFVLWKHHIIFEMVPYLLECFLLILGALAISYIQSRKELKEEAGKRQQIEKEFLKKVQSAAELERDFQELREKYQIEIASLRNELIDSFKSPAHSIQEEFPEIICSATSPLIKILAEIKRIGETDAPVFITGESGTGKELIARAIHANSNRAHDPFIPINCSAIPESLLESELFGYEKGAFTGANNNKMGFFEAANNGTIFLDEISETSLSFQTKLLRVLQDGTFYRVGSTEMQKVDVRIIAASNQNIEQLLETGKLRQDLYYRLNVLSTNLPPLRDRVDDIPVLLNHFIGNSKIKISTTAIDILKKHTWPGNVRELMNVAQRIRLVDDNAIVTSHWIRSNLQLGTQAKQQANLGEEILALFQELEFRNSANTEIAQRLGNLHRSTITEYLKGVIFKTFLDAEFDLNKTVRKLNPHPNDVFDQRIRNRSIKYLKNLRDKLNPNLSVAKNAAKLKAEMRKLPKRYHGITVEVAKAYLKGLWKL